MLLFMWNNMLCWLTWFLGFRFFFFGEVEGIDGAFVDDEGLGLGSPGRSNEEVYGRVGTTFPIMSFAHIACHQSSIGSECSRSILARFRGR